MPFGQVRRAGAKSIGAEAPSHRSQRHPPQKPCPCPAVA
ncbi:hypothetical protein [Lysobacter gummosus]